MKAKNISVIGCGAWGLTLADLLAGKGHSVCVWAHDPELARFLSSQNRHPDLLKNITLDPKISYTDSLKAAGEGRDVVVLAVASPFYRQLCRQLAPYITAQTILVNVVKGLEERTGKRMSQVLLEEIPAGKSAGLAVLSGPNLALEIAQKQPAATVTASTQTEITKTAQELFFTDYFRVYTCPDVIGVELGGTLKNVIALAAGAVDGLGLGANTKSALVTRGLAEMTRLGVKMGAQPLTFMGLSGLGDLVTTCFSQLSRNRTVGFRLAQGEKLEAIIKDLKSVAEGIKTSRAAVALGQKYQVSLPVSEQVCSVVADGKDIRRAIGDLLSRSPKDESY